MSAPQKNTLQEIEHGELTHRTGQKVPFKVIHGWDAKSSLECDALWKAAWLEFLQQLQATEPDEAKQAALFDTISSEDMHWRWFDKAILLNADEYEWFHLHADGKPQAACLVYHPKASVLEPGNIFYVEYIASAPWNRKCDFRHREFEGCGEIILRAAQRYAVKQLKLRPGFCLHSLPKAEPFYTHKIKMVSVAGHEKDALRYFELTQALATKLMEAS